MMDKQKAVVLLSGGMDSATTLALANEAGYDCYALSFDYGQRHRVELQAASDIALDLGVAEHKFIQFDLGGAEASALTNPGLAVPDQPSEGIPVTYVPARNTVFLAFALGWAEVLEAWAIYIGVNAVDYSGYPDCRPEYIAAFERLANLATRAGVEGRHFSLHTPLIHLTKGQIIQQGHRLGVDYSRTVSCYSPDQQGRGCGVCDACRLRAKGFADVGIEDTTRYASAVLKPG